MRTSLTELTVSTEQEIHNEDTQTYLLSACDDPQITVKLQRANVNTYRDNYLDKKNKHLCVSKMFAQWRCSRAFCLEDDIFSHGSWNSRGNPARWESFYS